MVSKWLLITYNLLVNGVYWGCNPLTNRLLTSWDILVPQSCLKKQTPNIKTFHLWYPSIFCSYTSHPIFRPTKKNTDVHYTDHHQHVASLKLTVRTWKWRFPSSKSPNFQGVFHHFQVLSDEFRGCNLNKKTGMAFRSFRTFLAWFLLMLAFNLLLLNLTRKTCPVPQKVVMFWG